MASRACGARPSGTTYPDASPSANPSKSRRTAHCNSSSVGAQVVMSLPPNSGLCNRSFFHQNLKRRHISVPFNQSGNGSKALEGLLEQVPHGRRDARAMVVDANYLALVKLPDAVPGQVNLGNRLKRQSVKIGQCIPTVIAGTDINIIDVADDAAPRASRDLCKKFPFRDG